MSSHFSANSSCRVRATLRGLSMVGLDVDVINVGPAQYLIAAGAASVNFLLDGIRMQRITRIIIGACFFCATLFAANLFAASHREAPLIANDPAADNTDFYMFRSWTDPSKVVFILNVIPGQEPGAGPNYFNFADDVLYKINVDTNADGNAEDLVYEIRFKTEFRNPLQLPLSYVALPQITALNGPGSEGIILRQSYTVTQVRGGARVNLGMRTMYAVPSNVGPLTMPHYDDLAAQGIYPLGNGGKVFAGQRDETF
ncbi:MAG TPA: DUF4331 family protein, partial [Casimicrobiaceae bacterium]|nr:DUF4331 family protein [Casimicrobiaceae bacterium]